MLDREAQGNKFHIPFMESLKVSNLAKALVNDATKRLEENKENGVKYFTGNSVIMSLV